MQPLNTELILIRITGEDRPGLTASVTEILAKYDATILDIGQADIHNTLSLGILCKTEEQHSGFIMKELLFKASSLGVTVRFYPITTKEYEDWVNMQGKNRYILTLLGRKLSARQISAVTRILAEQGMNIDAIKRLTGRIPLDECESRTRACIEFFRSWHSERPYCHARTVNETGNRTGNGFLFPVGQYVPPDAPPHLLRYGLYAD